MAALGGYDRSGHQMSTMILQADCPQHTADNSKGSGHSIQYEDLPATRPDHNSTPMHFQRSFAPFPAFKGSVR